MDCKDCIHSCVCEGFSFEINNDRPCSCFKDKAHFIELKCKPGDVVYQIQKTCTEGGYHTKGEFFPYGSDCEYCCENCDKEFAIRKITMWNIQVILQYQNKFGKTVFLTHKEAEIALSKMNAESSPNNYL